MSYLLRTSTGLLKLKLSNELAKRIMNNVSGQFNKLDFKEGNKIVTRLVFELKEDRTMHPYDSDIVIYLWDGDRLIPADD